MAGFLSGGKFHFEVIFEMWPDQILDLANVRYILARNKPDREPIIDNLDSALVVTADKRYVSMVRARAGGAERDAILAHAPARVSARLHLGPPGPGTTRLALGAALLDEAAGPKPGDGVFMLAAVRTNAGRQKIEAPALLYARHFGRPAGWKERVADIGVGGLGTGMDGAAIELSSLPGPRDDRTRDYATWALPAMVDPALSGRLAEGYDLVYDREVLVYENPDVLPRVFSVTTILPMRSIEDFIGRARSGTASVRDTAWLYPEDMPENKGPFSRAEVTVNRHRHGRIELETSSEGPSFLVLSNYYYRGGWHAWLDGEEVRVRRVNGLMCGLAVPGGGHEIVMGFAPRSLLASLFFKLTSLAAAATILIASFFRLRGARPRPASDSSANEPARD